MYATICHTVMLRWQRSTQFLTHPHAGPAERIHTLQLQGVGHTRMAAGFEPASRAPTTRFSLFLAITPALVLALLRHFLPVYGIDPVNVLA